MLIRPSSLPPLLLGLYIRWALMAFQSHCQHCLTRYPFIRLCEEKQSRLSALLKDANTKANICGTYGARTHDHMSRAPKPLSHRAPNNDHLKSTHYHTSAIYIVTLIDIGITSINKYAELIKIIHYTQHYITSS